MAKRCKEELLNMLEEYVSEKTGSSLVLGTVVTNVLLACG